MRYLLLIYAEEPTEAVPEDAMAAELGRYNTFTEDIVTRGLYRAGEALRPTSTATTVRIREGRTLTTDGPFAETKEKLGCFYLIDAKDLDQAIDVAAKIPAALHGSIEVRPIWELPSGDMAGGNAAEAVAVAR